MRKKDEVPECELKRTTKAMVNHFCDVFTDDGSAGSAELVGWLVVRSRRRPLASSQSSFVHLSSEGILVKYPDCIQLGERERERERETERESFF